MRKLYALLRGAREAEVGRTLPQQHAVEMTPHAVSLDQDLDAAAQVLSCELFGAECCPDLRPFLCTMLSCAECSLVQSAVQCRDPPPVQRQYAGIDERCGL